MSLSVRRSGSRPPAISTQTGWAKEVVDELVADIATNILPTSALVQLRTLSGLPYEFVAGGNVRVPAHTPVAKGGFVGEAGAIPVVELTFAAVKLEPRKAAAISAISNELLKGAAANTEISLRTLMAQDVGLAVDTILLDTTARDALRPAGLRNGVAALIPAAPGGNLGERVAEDVRALLAAISPAVVPTIIANAAQVAGLRAQGPLVDLITTPVLSVGTVIAVDAGAFVSAIGPLDISATEGATLHMEGTTPLPYSTVGSPNVVAAPERDLWQTATLALRTILDADWSLRRANAVSWMSGVNW
jgi:hypothetical protein